MITPTTRLVYLLPLLALLPGLALAQQSDTYKECYEAFHRQNGSWWQRNIVNGDNDSSFNHLPCLPFVTKDLRTWTRNVSQEGSTQSTQAQSNSQKSNTSLGGILDALKSLDQSIQDDVAGQFPGSSKQETKPKTKSSEAPSASRSYSIESKSLEAESIRGLWKSDAGCFVHIYETYDGRLGGAAWGKNRESGELSIEIASDRRFPWKRTARSSVVGELGERDPARKGRFIIDLHDEALLHSDLSPCFLKKGSPARWNRLSHWYDPDPDPSLYPDWYRRVYGAVVDDINTKSAAALEAKRKQDEARRIAEAKKAEEERLRKEAERIAAEKKAEEERLAAEKREAEERARQVALEQAKRVTRAQSGLEVLDVYDGEINGVLDTNTLAALAKWAALRNESPPVEINDQIVTAIESDAAAERARKEALAEEERRRQQEERGLLVQSTSVLLDGITAYLKQAPAPANFLDLLKSSRALKKAVNDGTNDQIITEFEILQNKTTSDLATSEFLVKWEEERQAELARQEALHQKQEEERLQAEKEAQEHRQRELLAMGAQYAGQLRTSLAADLDAPDFESKLSNLEQLEQALANQDYASLEAIVLLLESELVWCVGESAVFQSTRSECRDLTEKEFSTEISARNFFDSLPVWCVSNEGVIEETVRNLCPDDRSFASQDDANAYEEKLAEEQARNERLEAAKRASEEKERQLYASDDSVIQACNKFAKDSPMAPFYGTAIKNPVQYKFVSADKILLIYALPRSGGCPHRIDMICKLNGNRKPISADGLRDTGFYVSC